MSTNKNTSQALVCRFISALLRDEVPQELVVSMGKSDFPARLAEGLKASDNPEWADAALLFAQALESSPENLYRELRFEYAEMFLGVGIDPVFPYESAHMTQLPLVRQTNVFDLRAAYRNANVRPNPNYKDLEEHIAVEFEFLAHCLDTGRKVEFDAFLKDRLQVWAPAFFNHLLGRAVSQFYRAVAKLGLGSLVFLTQDAPLPDSLTIALASLPLENGLTTLVEGADQPLPDTSIATHCYTCGALCGMTAKLTDGILTGTVGLPGDPKGGGKLCPKGGSAPKHVYSAYRLKAPLVKDQGRFRKASWDEALARMADGIRSIPEGKLAYFRGNDYCNWIHEALFGALGCPKGTHRTMCDNSNRMWNEHTQNDKRPWINYEESDYILHFGMNELATSYGQRKTAG